MRNSKKMAQRPLGLRYDHTSYGIKLPMSSGRSFLDLYFFLDLFRKIGDKMGYRNRGGLRSSKNAVPACLEITGTQTFSASGRKARCIPSRYAALFRAGLFRCVAMEENRYRDTKGVISNFLQVVQRDRSTMADLVGW